MPKQVEKKAGLAAKLQGVKPKKTSNEPLWKGPENEGPLGGITQSMLNKFLGCRERFRITYIEGLQPAEGFDKHLEYGQMWHACEEALSAGRPWEADLKVYCQELCKKYRLQQEEVEKWYNVCKLQFPLYVEYWKKHPDNLKRTPLMQEQVFHVPYKLPSGRTVYLRGKFDAVDLIGAGRNAGVYLQENKTKGDINSQKLQRQLTFDLQTMIYLVALGLMPNVYTEKLPSIKGVRYNVIRRPLSGGRGSIVRHKARGATPEETYESYYSRLSGIIKEDCESDDTERNQYWFSRWKVEVSQSDIEAFKSQCLNPLLEQLCDWYSWIAVGVGPNPKDPFQSHSSGIHWRHPFGCYNVLDEGGSHELDEYLLTGSETGLTRTTTLFKEL